MASPDYGYQEDDRLAGDSQFLFSEKSIRHGKTVVVLVISRVCLNPSSVFII